MNLSHTLINTEGCSDREIAEIRRRFMERFSIVEEDEDV